MQPCTTKKTYKNPTSDVKLYNSAWFHPFPVVRHKQTKATHTIVFPRKNIQGDVSNRTTKFRNKCFLLFFATWCQSLYINRPLNSDSFKQNLKNLDSVSSLTIFSLHDEIFFILYRILWNNRFSHPCTVIVHCVKPQAIQG